MEIPHSARVVAEALRAVKNQPMFGFTILAWVTFAFDRFSPPEKDYLHYGWEVMTFLFVAIAGWTQLRHVSDARKTRRNGTPAKKGIRKQSPARAIETE